MRAAVLFLVLTPLTLAAQLRGTALVANQEAGTATVIDLASGRSVHIPVGTGPHEAAILPGGTRGVVTVYGDRGTVGHELAVIDLRNRRLDRIIELGSYTRPHGVVPIAGRPNHVAVTSETTRQVVVVDVATGTVERAVPTQAPSSHMVALPTVGASAGTRAWTANVASGSVSEVDLVGGAHIRVIPVASSTEGIAITPDGSTVWVGSNDRGTVSVVNTTTGVVTDTIPGLGMPYRLGVTPDATMAIAVDPRGDRILLLDVATRSVVGEVTGLQSPRGVAIAADSLYALITSAGASSAILVDLHTRREIRRFEVEASPDGVALLITA
jgi:YVTN family beta-propeller protein